MRYRSKPVDVEAMRWNPRNPTANNLQDTAADIVLWVNRNGGEARYEVRPARIAVRTVLGWAHAAPGHYVVSDTTGFYPCDPETFERLWVPAEPTAAARAAYQRGRHDLADYLIRLSDAFDDEAESR